jgi:hypothetical protein
MNAFGNHDYDAINDQMNFIATCGTVLRQPAGLEERQLKSSWLTPAELGGMEKTNKR